MKRLFALTIALFILAIPVLACGTANNTGTAATTGDSSNTSTPSPTPTHFQVGQAVNVGPIWTVTINSAKTSHGGQFDTLKSGDLFLEISVTLKNRSNQEQAASSALDWSLQDSTGQKYTLGYASDAPDSPDGKVEAGDQIKGTLVFEVPSAMKSYELAFAPDLFSSGETIWNITIK